MFVSSCTAINLPPFFIHHICCSIIAAMLYLQLPLLQSSPNCSNTEITAACRWSLSTLEIKQNQIHERTEIQIEDLKDRKINGVMKWNCYSIKENYGKEHQPLNNKRTKVSKIVFFFSGHWDGSRSYQSVLVNLHKLVCLVTRWWHKAANGTLY